jgi:hypothetical protein
MLEIQSNSNTIASSTQYDDLKKIIEQVKAQPVRSPVLVDLEP